ncbi:MAG: flagellar filament outer layer protein FlaA, partial [Anaerolineae bacterium]
RPVATPTKAPAPPARSGLVLDFEQDQTWRRGDEPYGAFTRSTEQAKLGASSGKLAYDFAAVTNNYVVFELRPAKALSGNPTGLTAWVFGDGSGHFLNVWIKDKASEVRAYSFGQIYHQGWQQMTAWFNDQAPWPAGHISGPDNQVLDYPVSFFQFALDGVPDGSASRGAIYLDEVFITNAPIPIGPTPTPPNVNPVPTISGSAQLTFAPGRDALAAAGSLLSLGLLLGFALLGAWPTRRR